jgi:hypothetical protein
LDLVNQQVQALPLVRVVLLVQVDPVLPSRQLDLGPLALLSILVLHVSPVDQVVQFVPVAQMVQLNQLLLLIQQVLVFLVVHPVL